MPCGALPSSSPCFFFNEGGKQKQKHVWDWKHRDRDSHNSSWREREKERDPKEFLEIVSMVTNRCRSKYISSLSPLGQQQQMQPKQFKQEWWWWWWWWCLIGKWRSHSSTLLQQQQQQQQQQVKHCCCFMLPQQIARELEETGGFAVAPAGACWSCCIWCRPTTIPSSSSSFSWHNRQFTSPLHTGETKTMCACMSTIQSILCICRSSRHMLVNARFRNQNPTLLLPILLLNETYWPIFFQLLNFAKKEKKIQKWSDFARFQLPKLRTKKKKKAKFVYMVFSCVARKYRRLIKDLYKLYLIL